MRHVDGSPVKSDAERERVIQCLEAGIERRVSEVRTYAIFHPKNSYGSEWKLQPYLFVYDPLKNKKGNIV